MRNEQVKYLIMASLSIIVVMGCNLANNTVPTEDQKETTASVFLIDTQTPSIKTETLPATLPDNITSTPPPSVTPILLTPTESIPSSNGTSEPVCVVLQDLNMRTGPGTAYRPPLRSLPAQTILEPLGYNPVGIPGGPWLQAKDRVNNQIGWVSAGSQYISCNIVLTTLPSVAVAPPAPPAPPNTNNSTPDGSFPPNFVWEADFNQEYFVRFRVYDTIDGGKKDGDGIASVSFQVLDDNGKEVYQRTERQAGFCIFGGGEPNCNPWTLDNITYLWKSGGEPVEAGEYKLFIVVSALSGEQGNWNYDIQINIP